MGRVLIFGLLLFTIISCNNRKEYSVKNSLSEQFISVDFDDVIAQPDSFDGKRVEISGFFADEFENVALYPTKWDAWNHNSQKAFWISLNKELNLGDEGRENMSGERITVRGTFDASDTGHLAQYAGSISDIVYIKYQ